MPSLLADPGITQLSECTACHMSSSSNYAAQTVSALLQGPIVYGGKIENRFKQSDKLKVVVATATLMNKPEQHGRKEQAWNHSAEVRFKALEDDKMLVSLLTSQSLFTPLLMQSAPHAQANL